MNMTKKVLLKSLPYLAAIITGGIFYFLANKMDPYYDLLINISATFFAIPLLYLFYETAKSFSHKRLNREIFDYAKMQIDRELLSILNQLQKIVYTLDKKDFSNRAINKFLSFQKDEIESQIKQNKYLGFQIFKNWETSEKGLHEILKNPFILEKLEDEQIISIINKLKRLRYLESVQKIDVLYIDTEERAEGYEIQNGIEINPENNKFPNRWLLLKHLDKDKFIVWDFGDIPKYNLKKCLNYYEINSKQLEAYSAVIFELLKDINGWLDVTGKEFVIDTKMFRMQGKQIMQ